MCHTLNTTPLKHNDGLFKHASNVDVGSKATGRSRATAAGEGSHELRQAEEQLATRHVSEGRAPALGRAVTAGLTAVSFKRLHLLPLKVPCILKDCVVLQKKKYMVQTKPVGICIEELYIFPLFTFDWFISSTSSNTVSVGAFFFFNTVTPISIIRMTPQFSHKS